MVFISATRLKLRSFRYLPAFFMTEAAVKRVLSTSGLLAGKEMPDKGLTFWTVTMWPADADMKAFRNSAPHRKAMQKLPKWCCEATYTHWLQEEATIPDWQTIHAKMIGEDGRVTKVRKPTALHGSKNFALPAWPKAERVF